MIIYLVSSLLHIFYNMITIFIRGLFIIDDKGILRQITMNDLPVCTLKCVHACIRIYIYTYTHVYVVS